ncbi:MAG: oxaloacetate decarboxylase subunit alpha [Lachnospiraceae bacterium]|jgi:oxaloacetate decarboxylase alpha subunit
MSENIKKPIKITETILRDAHQSLIATRLSTEEMLPIIPKLDRVGYNSVECWGGATFDAALRFLHEDPWERLRKFREGFKNTKLQMLFRGQNILGYRPYADDVVEYFVQKSVANGIDIIRIFDCLNDLRNLKTAVGAANKEGAHAQVALSYTLGDAYDLEYWVSKAKEIEEMGADSICIKDMAGLLVPYKATELVHALKESTKLPIELHTHYTSGEASMTYLKAVEAGVDIIDCAISPFALGTSQPATEVMVETFRGTEYDSGLDLNLLAEIADYFRPLREKYLANGLMNPKNMGVDIKTLLYQVPGGMLSNLTSQLAQAGAEDKFYEVLEEVPRVRKDMGEPPLVTPSSQIVGTQAVLNVITGERYKMVPKESKDIFLGKYGKSTLPFDPEIQKKCIGDETPITCRPADLIPNELENLEKEVAEYKEQDEDVLSYALFPQVAMDFFKYRAAQKTGVDEKEADTKNNAYPV